MNKVNKIDKAYSGKIVYHGNKPYQLVPELKKGMCEGCSLYNSSCPTRVTVLKVIYLRRLYYDSRVR